MPANTGIARTSGANGASTTPQISPDYANRTTNLVENDFTGVSDSFVRDRLLGLFVSHAR